MKNIAIIPARSGSKALIDKNIKLLNNVPLIGYSIEAAKRSNLFSDIMVSTDSEKYAEVAVSLGADVPFLRSSDLSSDTASSWDVVKEVLSHYQTKFDTVCLLQPTSPLRTSNDIIEGYKELELRQADAITSVCIVDHSPLWCTTLDADHSLLQFRKKETDRPRQQLDVYYRINGALYIRKLKYDNNSVHILDDHEYAYIMDRGRSVDIDTIDDFEYAEYLIKKSN